MDISDKLTDVFGELKNNIEKKLSDKFNDFKKKTKKFFGIFESKEIEEEEEILHKNGLKNKRLPRHAESTFPPSAGRAASNKHSQSGKILKQVQDDKVCSTKRKINDKD